VCTDLMVCISPAIFTPRRGSTVYIAHVNNRSHFVLLTGVVAAYEALESTRTQPQPSTFYVNDPYFNQTTYTYDSIADIISYTVLRPIEPKAYTGFDQCTHSSLCLSSSRTCPIGDAACVRVCMEGMGTQLTELVDGGKPPFP
jgi:hypothetical protein